MTDEEKREALTAEFVFILHNILNPKVCETQFDRLFEALNDNDKLFEAMQTEWRARLENDKVQREATIERTTNELAAIEAKLAELPVKEEVSK